MSRSNFQLYIHSTYLSFQSLDKVKKSMGHSYELQDEVG